MVHRTRLSIVVAAVCIGIAGCSAGQRAEMEADKLAQYDLSASQTDIAQAFVAGMKIENNTPLLRSRDYARIACYAKSVEMPARMKRAHLLYLENYVEADRDYYPFFARQGIGEQLAYDMFEIYRAAWDECSLGRMMKKRLNDG
jgi:hypothetical protein